MKIEEQIRIIPRKRITDLRGLFLKPLTGLESGLKREVGEVYITTALPGYYRGNHYHNKTNEWFTLVTGEAMLILEDISSHERMQITIKAEDANTYFIPARLAHVFINPEYAKTEFMLVAYADLSYDETDTITYNLLA